MLFYFLLVFSITFFIPSQNFQERTKIYEKNENSYFKEFSDKFIQQNGSIKCHEIKKLKKVTCVECIEQAVEYLENNEKKV